MDHQTSIAGTRPDQPLQRWITNYGWVLIAAYLYLQPFGHAFELPIFLMACLGLWLGLSQPSALMAFPAFRPMVFLFACIWLPMLFSLTDAVNLSRSAQTTLVFLRFPLAGVFIFYALQQSDSRRRLFIATGIALSLASLVLVVMALSGHSVKGVVAGTHFPIGQLLGGMSAVLLFWILQMAQNKRWFWLILPMSGAAMLFSGSRSSWIMFACAYVLFMVSLIFVNLIRVNKKTMLATLLLLVIGVSLAVRAPTMGERISVTRGLFSGDYRQSDVATGFRFDIWKVATHVAQDHWINGVGPRGFRYVYSKYVPGNDFWLSPNKDNSTNSAFLQLGPNHPHQFFLEVAAETGGIGLLGYLFAFIYWIRLTINSARKEMNTAALPWMLAVIVAIMPINAHMAFYASFWSCLTWWLIAVSLAYWQAPKLKPPSKGQTID
jgi:O-antigen ligase